MRATWRLAGLAVLGAAGGEARAMAPADTTRPAVPVLPPALERLDLTADMAGTTLEDGGFPGLRFGLLPADPPGSARYRLVGRDPGSDRRDRFGIPAALNLIVAPRALLPAPIPRPGSRRARLLLPVWVQMAFGSWSILGGGSYASGGGAGVRDTWRSSFTLIRTLSPRLSLGAEFTHDTADLIDSHSNTALGIGARYRLTGPLSLLVSGGPYVEHHGGTGVKAYAGFGLAF